ncbi:MAG: chemotaxis protein CheW [Cyanobacteria bacterium J06600_6]
MQISSAAERIRANLQDLFKAEALPGNPYVKFSLTSEITALLSMEHVEESGIIDAENVTPLPSMPESVIGMTNSEDRVFCIFDFAQLLHLPSPLTHLRQYQIIVLNISKIINREETVYMGLAVQELQGLVRYEDQDIDSQSTASLAKDSYMSGAILTNDTELLIIDIPEILKDLTVVH